MSALTLYLQDINAPFQPTTKRGAWDESSVAWANALGAKDGVSAWRAQYVASLDADHDVMVGRFVSGPLAADTYFTGAIDGVIGVRENHGDVNAKLHLHVFVLVGQTDVLRGTLWADYIDPDEASEFATTAGEGFSGTMTNLQALLGDTVVVETGVRANATSTAYTAYIYRGCTHATDLADGADAATYPGWIRLAYGAPPSDQTIVADGIAPATAIGTPTVTQVGGPQTIVANGIAPTAAFGQPTIITTHSSIETYGVQRGIYTDKECKSSATMTATLQRLVAQSAWYRNAYSVQVTDEAAALCIPGDTAHFVYGSINESLRILEITRSTESNTASFKVANITEDLTDKLESTRKEIATLNKSYQGVPNDSNDSFSEQFERTAGGTDVPAEVGFYVPYGADLIDLRLRYQIGGMRSFAKAVGGGGGTNTPSGGGSTSGGGGGQTSSSVGTPSGGGATSGATGAPSGGGSTTGQTTSDLKTLPSVTRNPASSGVRYDIQINPTDRDQEYIYFSIGNFTGGSRTFYCDVYTGPGGSGTLVGATTTSPGDGAYGAAVVTTSSYSGSTLYASVTMSAGDGSFLFCATRYGYSQHGHSTPDHTHPNHTHSTPDHTHPNHSHTVSDHYHSTPAHQHALPDHAHTLSYGIYESSTPATVRVYLDGALISGLNDLTYVSDYDLMPYIGKDSNGRCREGWRTLEFKSATNGATGSVRGTIFTSKFLSTEAA